MKKKAYTAPSTETVETGAQTLFATSSNISRGRRSGGSDDPTAEEGIYWGD